MSLWPYIFNRRLIVWNIVALVFVKLVFSYSAFQWATLLGPSTSFNSRDIIVATNEARVKHNLSVLKANNQLDTAAVEKVQDMAVKDYFAHFSPTGVSPWYWMEKNNYRYAYAGENIAIGFINANDTVRAWLDSPSHRANLLNTKYQEIGVGTAEVEIEGIRGTLVVQMFGRPATAVAIKSKPKPKVVAKATKIPNPAVPAAVVPSPLLKLVDREVKAESVVSIIPAPTKEPAVKFEYVSTDEEVKPVSRVIKVETAENAKIKNWARGLNNIYLIYIFAMAGLSLVALLFIKRDQWAWIGVAVHVGLFILAIVFPLASASTQGWIF